MIEIDECHVSFIVGLIRSAKPYLVLELGYGTGLTTKSIVYALLKNKRGNLIVVDNFKDWDYKKPEHVFFEDFTFVESDEKSYLEFTDKHFDVIVCDADHKNTDKHVDMLLNRLNPNGYIIFHDVTNSNYPNLENIIRKLPNGFLFNESSTKNEQCFRGLYVYKKSTIPIPIPICELCDRLTIAQLKKERLDNNQIDKNLLQKQIDYYTEGVDTNNIKLVNLITSLYHINSLMWDAEHDIRKGLDNELGYEEIGKRAIHIRDLNKQRVSIKNEIAEVTNQQEFIDCKMNHVSS